MFNLCTRGIYFLGAQDSYEKAKIVLIGIPLELTASFRPGARDGPQAIRSASQGLEAYSPYLNRELGECNFYDGGDLVLPFGNLGISFKRIEQICRVLVEDDKLPFFLGGEHLLSFPVIKVLAEFYPNLAVLHFDAHADLRDDYLGENYSHATVIRRICEVVGSQAVFQFGIRSGTKEEFIYGRSFTNFYPFTLSEALEACRPHLTGRPLYVTLDIDLVDPAYAPGTGTPEPGGFTPQEAFYIFDILQGLHVVGCDFVELAPPYDPSGITSLLAAKLVREGLLAFSRNL
ncbi:MAG: agmatinase [Bacillota bacterium]|nr:agmatinase [Bacillota bacterium]